MSDLVTRLHRTRASSSFYPGVNDSLIEEAAGEIERLQAERDEWKQAASVEAGLRREFAAELTAVRKQFDEAKADKEL